MHTATPSGSPTTSQHQRHSTAAVQAMSLSDIRPATPDDAPSIAALGTRVFASTFGHSCTVEQMQTYLQKCYSVSAIASDLANPNKTTIVATGPADGGVLGFATLTKGTTEPCLQGSTDEVELQRLYVDEAHQGKGIAKKLSDQIEELAIAQGFAVMWLGVWEFNYKAQKFYEKRGYSRVGEHVFDVGGDVQTDWILIKQLKVS